MLNFALLGIKVKVVINCDRSFDVLLGSAQIIEGIAPRLFLLLFFVFSSSFNACFGMWWVAH